jgi:hypothetical protein
MLKSKSPAEKKEIYMLAAAALQHRTASTLPSHAPLSSPPPAGVTSAHSGPATMPPPLATGKPARAAGIGALSPTAAKKAKMRQPHSKQSGSNLPAVLVPVQTASEEAKFWELFAKLGGKQGQPRRNCDFWERMCTEWNQSVTRARAENAQPDIFLKLPRHMRQYYEQWMAAETGHVTVSSGRQPASQPLAPNLPAYPWPASKLHTGAASQLQPASQPASRRQPVRIPRCSQPGAERCCKPDASMCHKPDAASRRGEANQPARFSQPAYIPWCR